MSQRHHPYARGGNRSGGPRKPHDPNAPRIGDELDKNVVFPSNSVRVGSNQHAKEIAVNICNACRTGRGEMPALLTIGASSINQAVKAIAIASADLLNDGYSLSFQPAFRHADRTKPFIAFYLNQERNAFNNRNETELTVTAYGKTSAVAGAIAGKTREGQRVCLAAMGVDAVTNAVLAIGNARLYLEQDGLDIKVQPEFEHVEKDGEQRTALKMHVQFEEVAN